MKRREKKKWKITKEKIRRLEEREECKEGQKTEVRKEKIFLE
jgi:hypothetical protein